jgi:hypothetical protein
VRSGTREGDAFCRIRGSLTVEYRTYSGTATQGPEPEVGSNGPVVVRSRGCDHEHPRRQSAFGMLMFWAAAKLYVVSKPAKLSPGTVR